ncbi:MAG TPA: type III-B CRISPR-associated protein Cas10/Cmr2, partial [Candidatus Goldiibacteriota bacterium]|nr:type III-B CRISPR-associated protein Cas10/Cmr2 [Candidatus Goldiibacteriota bacterium]
FKIQGHEQRAKEIADLLFQSSPIKDDYSFADRIASGLTRAALPGYSDDKNKDGSVDFLEHPFFTHPLVAASIKAEVPENTSIDKIHSDILNVLKKDIGIGLTKEQLDSLKRDNPDKAPLNAFFKGYKEGEKDGNEEWTKALYSYFFFAFKKRLRQEKAGGIGALWDMIPADTRMPDHSLWNHCALTSAIGSSAADDPEGKVSLSVFSITPVQQFISKARKLKDFWTGSVILSYLAFWGIKYISENYGPDHIVYPSLHDQALIEYWLARDFHLGGFIKEKDADLITNSEKSASIASFPNKFVFLCASFEAQKICLEVKEAVQKEWVRIAGLVKEMLSEKAVNKDAMKNLFDHQISDYWQFSYSSCRLIGVDDAEILEKLVKKAKWEKELDTITDFSKEYGKTGFVMYGSSHALAQSLLAASKMKPDNIRKPQQGKKCPLCGEHEVLSDFEHSGQTAEEYNAAVQNFWKNLYSQDKALKDGEQLCAVCAVKRFIPEVVLKTGNKNEMLYGVMDSLEGFSSTTAMAASSYLNLLAEKGVISHRDISRCADQLHEMDEDGRPPEFVIKGKAAGVELTNRDKYYAVLLMDGDKMGDLINGITLSAKWEDVIHPVLKQRMENPSFAGKISIKKHLKNMRLINPSLHASVSDALNSFARYAVLPVIEKYGGKLIYAGGDDVCAVLPVDNAIAAAEDIRQAYGLEFVGYGRNGAQDMPVITAECVKAGVHLGKNEKISISAAVVIAHHKEPLRDVIKDAHYVLDKIAKEKAGRGAAAVRLKKRSGGDRDFYFKWDDLNDFNGKKISESFRVISDSVEEKELGSAMVYRLENLKPAVEPFLKSGGDKEKILKLFEYEILHSGIKAARETKIEQAKNLAGLCVKFKAGQKAVFNSEAAIIARFLAVPAGRKKRGVE